MTEFFSALSKDAYEKKAVNNHEKLVTLVERALAMTNEGSDVNLIERETRILNWKTEARAVLNQLEQ